MGDWDHAWRTMDNDYTAKQLDVFQQMVSKGLIYRRYKPVHWSPSSQTALAEAELDKNEVLNTAAFVMFPLRNLSTFLQEIIGNQREISVVIWTTLPWTLPANRAVLVNKDIQYSIVEFRGTLLLLATSRLEYVAGICFAGEPYKIVADDVRGADLVDATYVNPIHGRDSEPRPILHGDFVTEDSGTGIVHSAPGHGADDYRVCHAHGIEAWAPVDDLGRFTKSALPSNPAALDQLPVLGAGNDAVLKLMGDSVLSTHKHRKQVYFDWRTKGPTFERATAQWFADIDSIKADALERLNHVNFMPESGRLRLQSFIKGRSEWCISRQRPWGVPIPALYDEDGKALLDSRIVKHIQSMLMQNGADSWWLGSSNDPSWLPDGLDGAAHVRGKDTMDVWFDSGTSWTQMPEGVEQADVYVEGTDQHRGWFQSSLLTHTGSAQSDKAPFKMVITHGFTLDDKGRKMSKSEGNVTDPNDIINGTYLAKNKGNKKARSTELGVDVLRLWVASSDFTKDITVGLPVLMAVNKALLKYRVTLKMLLGTMTHTARKLPISRLDCIALVQLRDTMKIVSDAYERYEFYKAVHEINRWINNDLSAFYLDGMKDRLYCGDGGGVLEEMFDGLLRMLAPITPSLVQEAWSHRPSWMLDSTTDNPVPEPLPAAPFISSLSDEVIRDERFTSLPALHVELERVRTEIPWIQTVKAAVNAAIEQGRTAGHTNSSLRCSVVLYIAADDVKYYTPYTTELANIFVVSQFEIVSTDAEHEHAAKEEPAWAYETLFQTPRGQTARVVVRPSAFDVRCQRCWQYIELEHSGLCTRCDAAV